jgi:hypothetical protein
MSFSLLSAADESATLPSGMQKKFRQIRLEFNHSSIPPELRFDMLAITSQTREENRVDVGKSSNWEEGGYTYAVVPVSAQSITIKLAVYPVLNAEFVAKPIATPPAEPRVSPLIRLFDLFDFKDFPLW